MTAQPIDETVTAGAQPEPGVLSISAADLRSLLAPLTPYVDQQGMLPALDGYQITTTGGHVSAVATNRFTAARHRLPNTDSADGVSLFLTSSAFKTITRLWPVRKASSAAFRFVVTDDKVRVEQVGGLDGIVDAHLTFDRLGVDPPNVDKILDEYIEAADRDDTERPSSIGMNPVYLAALKSTPVAIGGPVWVDLVERLTDGREAHGVLVRTESFTAVLRAMRTTRRDVVAGGTR